MMQRQVPTIQKTENTVEVHQSQVVDKVEVPVVLQRQAPMIEFVHEIFEVDCGTRRSHEAA